MEIQYDSFVIRSWITAIKENLNSDVTHKEWLSQEWLKLRSRVRNTTRGYEDRRLKIILDWMWDLAPLLRDIAASHGILSEWDAMLRDRTARSAILVANAAYEMRSYMLAYTANNIGDACADPDYDTQPVAIACAARSIFAVEAVRMLYRAYFEINGANCPYGSHVEWIRAFQPIEVLRKLIELN
jgi:hypothetical protein